MTSDKSLYKEWKKQEITVPQNVYGTPPEFGTLLIDWELILKSI
jgi:hypothetical protein